MLEIVDLPHPEFPMRKTVWPAGMSRSRPLRILTLGRDGYLK